MAGFPWFVCYSRVACYACGREGRLLRFFPLTLQWGAFFFPDSYDKSSCFLSLLIIHFWIHQVEQFCTGWEKKKSNCICPDSCDKQEIWKEEAWQVKAGWVSVNFGPSSENPLLPASQKFLILICSHLNLVPGFPLPPRSVCGLLLMKDKCSAQPPPSAIRALLPCLTVTQKQLGTFCPWCLAPLAPGSSPITQCHAELPTIPLR